MYTDAQDHITMLPVELIKEVGSCLEYSEVQTFRLVSKRVNDAVEAQALSRLQLDWAFDCDSTSFPLVKLQAYLTPGSTRAYHFVRHLTIGNVCLKLDADVCCFHPQNVTEAPAMTMELIKAERRSAFKKLMEGLLLGESLKNLRTIKWEMINTSRLIHRWPVSLHSQLCTGTLEIVANTLFQRETPCQEIELDVSFGKLRLLDQPINQSVDTSKTISSDCWPCKTLRIGSLQPRPMLVYDFVLQWLEKVMSNGNRFLTAIDCELIFYDKPLWDLLERVHSNGTHLDTPTIQFRTLRLVNLGFTIQPQVLQHFRQLEKLVLYPQHDAGLHQTRRSQNAVLWLQLAGQNIYVADLTLVLANLDHTFLDYLDAFPPRALKSLTLESTFTFPSPPLEHRTVNSEHRLYESYEEGDLPARFYASILPSVSAGLEHLSINADRWYNPGWCLGTLPESMLAFKQCKALRSVCVTLDCVLTESDETFVNDVFGGCPLLRSVGTYDIHTGTKSRTIPLCKGGLYNDNESLFGED